MVNNIVFIGPDKSGKTTIAKELSQRLNWTYFKNTNEASLFKENNHLQNFKINGPYLLNLLKSGVKNIIFDRGIPCEYAYSKAYNRETDEQLIFSLDEEYAKLDTLIIYVDRLDYKKELFDEKIIDFENIKNIESHYQYFLNKTKCKFVHITTIGDNYDFQISYILAFIENKNKVNFQQCAQLEIKDEYSKSTNTLADIFNLQKNIQETVYKYDFEKIRTNIRSLKAFIDWNEEAIRDEDREFQAALTGIHSFPGRWKPWKHDHNEAMERSINDFTNSELLELQYEWIDKLHFMLNQAIAIKLTPELIFNMYFAKNLENRNRQKNGNY